MLLPGAGLVIIETCIRAVAVLICSFIAFLTFEVSRRDQLVISDEGLLFPLSFGPDLLFRRRRTWDDIGNILIGAMLREDKKGTYEYELEQAKNKNQLYIYFKSGGHACLDLGKIPKESVERIFQSIESWCISCARTPQPTKTIADKSKASRKKLEKLTYTEMWDDELHSHFSATSFVALEKSQCLQNGKYTVIMQLSSGGLSAVYLAELGDKDLVVIKEAALPADLKEEARIKAKAMFAREAEILKNLTHTNIAKVLDNFVERGRDYLVLEFIPGETLRQVVRKMGTQSEQVVLQYGLQIARILDYLHDQEPPILHRDLTPDNLVVNQDGQIVLIDFGAANTFLGTATGTVVGKQAYISPEQFRGKATTQSDIYSLGCTLHFMLTGEDPEALSCSHPQSKRADVCDATDALIASCTECDTSARLKSADVLIEQIESILPGTVLSVSSSRSQT
jgi:tRNA A-37 threonylcarbamoyl transferase component Bud32